MKPEEPKKPEEKEEEDDGDDVEQPERNPEYEDLREGQEITDRFTGENWKGYHQAFTV